jgi:hypothetical protein
MKPVALLEMLTSTGLLARASDVGCTDADVGASHGEQVLAVVVENVSVELFVQQLEVHVAVVDGCVLANGMS